MMLTTASVKSPARYDDVDIGLAVTKPVRPSDLLDAIIKAISKQKMPTEKRSHKAGLGQESLPPSLNILAAEDTPFNQKYIRRLLDSWQCQTTIVENGRLAIEEMVKQDFDLVLMDVQMPEMDGLTATTMIREQEKQTRRHMPIIAMTAHAMRGDRERCIEAGMDDYVSKPISSSTLLEAIQRVLPLSAHQVQSAPGDEPSEPVDDASALAALLEAFNNDRTLFKDVADMFITDYVPMVATVKKAISDKDAALLGRTAHALKGMARNFQIEAAADAARQLEQLAEQGQFENAQELGRRLADELAEYERRLKQMVARITED